MPRTDISVLAMELKIGMFVRRVMPLSKLAYVESHDS